MGSIANALNDNLIVRAADVHLKERRRLVLMVRETPFNATHLRLMHELTLAGAVICPPIPAFYHRPKTLMDLVDHSVGKALDQLGIAPQCGLQDQLLVGHMPGYQGPYAGRQRAVERRRDCHSAEADDKRQDRGHPTRAESSCHVVKKAGNARARQSFGFPTSGHDITKHFCCSTACFFLLHAVVLIFGCHVRSYHDVCPARSATILGGKRST